MSCSSGTSLLSVPHQLLVIPKHQYPSSSSSSSSAITTHKTYVPNNKSSFHHIRCSSSSQSVIEAQASPSPSESDQTPFPLSGCKACGKDEIERGCNGEGRIQGGIATVPGLGWWPIKAYRPCPEFVASGGQYRRQGQSMDEVAGFKKVEKAARPSNEPQSSKKKGTKKFKS